MGFNIKTGMWSIADQGVVSAGNFLTTILLVRALVPSEYGIYALLFALMLFVTSLHAAVVVYGLSLDGAAGTDAALRPLAGGSLVLTAALGTVLGVAVGIAAVLFHRSWLTPWILLAVVFWQLQETTRRALISRLRHRDALLGDALRYLGQTACIAYLYIAHDLNLTSVFKIMFLASAVAWLLQAGQLRLTVRDLRGAFHLLPNFWKVGRWMLLTNVAQGFIDQALLWFLALRGMAEVASFQSALNLIRAANPVMFAIGSVLLPTIAAQRGEPAAGLQTARRYGLLGGVILLPYFSAVFTFPSSALRLFYGANSAYLGLGEELRVLVVAFAFIYVAYVLGAYYNGLSRSYTVFRFQLVAVATALVGGSVLVMQAGVIGGAVAYGLAFAAETTAFVWYLRRRDPFLRPEEVSIAAAPEVEQS